MKKLLVVLLCAVSLSACSLMPSSSDLSALAGPQGCTVPARDSDSNVVTDKDGKVVYKSFASDAMCAVDAQAQIVVADSAAITHACEGMEKPEAPTDPNNVAGMQAYQNTMAEYYRDCERARSTVALARASGGGSNHGVQLQDNRSALLAAAINAKASRNAALIGAGATVATAGVSGIVTAINAKFDYRKVHDVIKALNRPNVSIGQVGGGGGSAGGGISSGGDPVLADGGQTTNIVSVGSTVGAGGSRVSGLLGDNSNLAAANDEGAALSNRGPLNYPLQTNSSCDGSGQQPCAPLNNPFVSNTNPVNLQGSLLPSSSSSSTGK